MTVRDAAGVEWSAKQGPEARVEVVTSRILSAVGYHQPPVYYVPSWTVTGGRLPGRQSEARFRPKIRALKDKGAWSWQQNPFVGTRPYRGLIVLMMILNESDLKNVNNTIYGLDEPREGARRWYVVRDLGTALGETGRLDPRRGDIKKFREHPFIDKVKDGYVRFVFHGLHQEIVKQPVTPADVHWICDLLSRLTLQQWRDGFRAGGYSETAADQFIHRIQEKIAEGMNLH